MTKAVQHDAENVGHPSYARPTVREAICEIEIDAGPSPAFSVNRPGGLFKVLIDRYPDIETLVMPTVRPVVGVPGQQAMTMVPAIRFSAPDASRQIVFSDTLLRVHQSAAYPGWPGLLAEVLNLWEQFCGLAHPKAVCRVGVRYVNIIPRTPEHPLPSDWLTTTSAISSMALASVGDRPFLSRTEAWLSTTNLMIINVALQVQTVAGMAPIIFDLAHSFNANTEPQVEILKRVFEELHEGVWREFQAAKTNRLSTHLDGVS